MKNRMLKKIKKAVVLIMATFMFGSVAISVNAAP